MKTNITRSLRLLCLTIAASLSGLGQQTASAAVTFPSTSEFASGKWVKVDFRNTGIYEISYDELRSMGFSDPTKVGVFGNGGQIQPMQFTDTKGNPIYTPTLKPVAMMHADNKIIFFGQGPALIRQLTSNISRPTLRQQFELVSNNSYTNTGSYFLTDSRTDMLVPDKVVRSINTNNPYYLTAWQVMYHELDSLSVVVSGREYWGENLKTGTSIPYRLNNFSQGDLLSMTIRPTHSTDNSGASIDINFVAGGSETTHSVSMDVNHKGDYYSSSSSPFFVPTLPGAEGFINMKYNGNSSYSYLDYFILAHRSRLDFSGGRPALMAYAGDFNSNSYSYIKAYNTPDDLVVWDVTTPNAVNLCPWSRSGNDANVRYLADNKTDGMVVMFSPSASQMCIESWSEVHPTDLPAIGLQDVPDMLIITLPHLRPAAERIAALHEAKEGLRTVIVDSEDVINEFSAGVPDPMAYRALCKMIYDRDNPENRKFKHLLLLGPCLRDYRNLADVGINGTLICNQSFTARNVDESFTLNDWYGMLEDYTPYTPDSSAAAFAKVQMQIAVGNLPCRDLVDAMAYVDKLETFYADDSFAYWLNEGNYVADGADNNEHQILMDALYSSGVEESENNVIGHKLYNNLYYYKGTTYSFARNLNTGSLTNYYLGHADPNGLNSEFWKPADELLLNNSRLGFMMFGACTVTAFDSNQRGTGESLIFLPNRGLIGGIMTTRSVYSWSNYLLSEYFQQACIKDNMDKDSPLLKAPRTVGEAYMMAKNTYTQNANKHAYVLLSDPALTLPIASASISMKVADSAPGDTVNVYPHQNVKVSGNVTDRKGALLSAFSGTVVAKVFNAPRERMTTPRSGAKVDTLMIEDSPLSIASFVVRNGKFEGDLTFPSTMIPTDTLPGVIRLAAYDATTRRGASGAVAINILEYDESKAVTSDAAPSIDALYINTESFDEGMMVAPDFTLYADISDDHAVMISEVNSFPSLLLTIDVRRTVSDAKNYVTLTEGGRKCRIAYPMKDMPAGNHTISLEAKDVEGQRAERTIAFRVGPADMSARLSSDNEPATQSAVFTLTPADNDAPESAVIVILDASGNEILSAQMTGDSYEWNLCDSKGNRVPAGPYTAVCRLAGNGLRTGVSTTCRKIVF